MNGLNRTMSSKFAILSLIAYLLIGSAVQAGRPRAAAVAESDHLFPSEPHIDPNYRRVLMTKLCLTQANYVRVLVLPPGMGGESALSIYSDANSDDSREVRVTCTHANASLWNWMSRLQMSKQHEPRVTRVDATFPSSVARDVSELARQLIDNRSSVYGDQPIVEEGTDVEFAVEVNGKPRSALLTRYSRGPRSEALHNLTRLLTQYCVAKPDRRTGLAESIKAEASRLLARKSD